MRCAFVQIYAVTHNGDLQVHAEIAMFARVLLHIMSEYVIAKSHLLQA